MGINYKTPDVREMLKKHRPYPEYILIQEVKRSTGYRPPERFADAVSIQMYPSKGCLVEGFEIKASRNDLLVELRDPEKAKSIKQFCDYWWLVVANEDALQGKKKIPEDWGILVAERFGLHTKRIATKLNPVPLDRFFLASLIRNIKSELGLQAIFCIDKFMQE